MASDNRIKGNRLAARCCYGAYFALGFVITALVLAVMFWIVWCYLGLSIFQISDSQRRALVDYSFTTTSKSPVTPAAVLPNRTEEPPSTSDAIESSLNYISKSATSTSSVLRGSSRGESPVKSDRGKEGPPQHGHSVAKGDFEARDAARANSTHTTPVHLPVFTATSAQKGKDEMDEDIRKKADNLSAKEGEDGIHPRRVPTSPNKENQPLNLVDSRDVSSTDAPSQTSPDVYDDPKIDIPTPDEKTPVAKDSPKPFKGRQDDIQSFRRTDADRAYRDPDFEQSNSRNPASDIDRSRYGDDVQDDRGSRSRYDRRDRGRDTDDVYSKGDTRVFPDDETKRTITRDRPLDDERLLDRAPLDDRRYLTRDHPTADDRYRDRISPDDKQPSRGRSTSDDRYRDRISPDDKQPSRDKSTSDDRYRDRISLNDKQPSRDRSTSDDSYRDRLPPDDDKYRDMIPSDNYRYPLHDRPVGDDRYRESIPQEDDKSRIRGLSTDDRYLPRDGPVIDDRSRDRIPQVDDRYRVRISKDDRYQDRIPEDDDRYRVRVPDDDRNRDRIPLDDDKYVPRDRSISTDRYRDRVLPVDDRYPVDTKLRGNNDRYRDYDRYRDRTDRYRDDDPRYKDRLDDARYVSKDERYRLRGDDRYRTLNEDRYRDRTVDDKYPVKMYEEPRRRESSDKFSPEKDEEGHRPTNDDGKYLARGDDEKYSEDTRRREQYSRTTLGGSRSDGWSDPQRTRLLSNPDSSTLVDRRISDVADSRGIGHTRISPQNEMVDSRSRITSTSKAVDGHYVDEDNMRPPPKDDRDRIIPTRVMDEPLVLRSRDETYNSRSTAIDGRRRDEDGYYDDRSRDTKYYYDEDRRSDGPRVISPSSVVVGGSSRKVLDDRDGYPGRQPKDKGIDVKYMDRRDDTVLDHRSYAFEDEDDYGRTNSRTRPYDDRDRKPADGQRRQYRDEDDEFPRRRDDDEEFRRQRPRGDHGTDKRYDRDQRPYRSDDADKAKTPLRKHDSFADEDSEMRRRESYDRKDALSRHPLDDDAADDSRTRRRDSYDRKDVPPRYLLDDDVTDDSGTRRQDSYDRESIPPRRPSDDDATREETADERTSRSSGRVSSLDHPRDDRKYTDSTSRYAEGTAGGSPRKSSPRRDPFVGPSVTHDDSRVLVEMVTREKRVQDSSAKESLPDIPRSSDTAGSAFLSAKDVIEAAQRHSDVPDQNNRKVFYPVFDPRLSNLTSPDVIRPSERRGTTIMSRRRRRIM